jgi:hypothetical protein
VEWSPGPVRCLAGLSGCAVVGFDACGGAGDQVGVVGGSRAGVGKAGTGRKRGEGVWMAGRQVGFANAARAAPTSAAGASAARTKVGARRCSPYLHF